MGTKRKASTQASNSASAGALFGSSADFDPSLSSLFSSSLGPVSKPILPAGPNRISKGRSHDDADEVDDEELSSIDSDIEDAAVGESDTDAEADTTAAAERDTKSQLKVDLTGDAPQKKRKRKRQDDDLEEQYMAKLVKSEAKELAKTQAAKRRARPDTSADSPGVEVDGQDAVGLEDDSDAALSPPPRHETVSGDQPDVEKAGRTVFLANVSTEAITSKSARKSLLSHLGSHLGAMTASKPPHKVESLRFRSTAFASALPKRAAFTKQELMDATTKATNAYAVYSTKEAAREAARKLNGTVVLGRHLRVDEVAHPAKTDNRRCVFVGNLGFVDDESIMEANEAEAGDKKKKKSKPKEPGDVEEGLWREFSKVGTVESVRVVRDAKTRVGKGFAYVQFTDENAVEAALLLNEKKFPPMLPRKLRVVRAKAVKRNAAKKGAPPAAPQANRVYAPKMSAQQQSLHGRAGRLFGKAGAAQVQGKRRARDRPAPGAALGSNIKPPEAFVFEGHRATGGQKPKLKVKKGNGGKPQSRGSKRAAAWKASGGKK